MEIQPEKQSLNETFSNKVYCIDFYQRDYKWTEEPVKRLLDDVFYQFDANYPEYQSLAANKNNINKYPWYFMNTYITNTVDGRVFIVDGQQRLTTITLILIALLKMAEDIKSGLSKWIESKICGYSGPDKEFWLHHAAHLNVLEELMKGTPLNKIDTSSGLTARNMKNNFGVICGILDQRLRDGRIIKEHRFETFVYYFICRLVLINLSVESQQVPMVFEVINDRGVRLKPHEILKGNLLGQIDKNEMERGNYPEKWENSMRPINAIKVDGEDDFFRYFLKAKFADSKNAGSDFDGDYHREIFKNRVNDHLKLRHNSAGVKTFLEKILPYYSNLYVRINSATEKQDDRYPCIFFNKINSLDNQFILLLSACKVDDEEEEEKLRLVSEGLDQISSLLQLQGIHDSNRLTLLILAISSEIREKPASDIKKVFREHLQKEIAYHRNSLIDPLADSPTKQQMFSWNMFRSMTVIRMSYRFIRYFFARIELFLSHGMKQGMKHDLKSLVTKSGPVTGFHIEHILSHNSENLALFDDDEELFDQERNRLGGILLMKGRDNISSNNEVYKEKLQSYANTLYWNETLRQDTYKSKLDFQKFIKDFKLPFRALDQFGPKELQERQLLLFNLACLIWDVEECRKDAP